jgi:hypothetical protein
MMPEEKLKDDEQAIEQVLKWCYISELSPEEQKDFSTRASQL